MTCEYDGGCCYTNSGPRSWKSGNAGRPGFVANWTGQMLSPILIYRLWTMALWLVLYKASRIARKIQTIYHQCSKHSYYHSIKKRSFWKNVHITKRSENINFPLSPNLRYPSAVTLFLSITPPGIDCEIESIWPGIRLPSDDPKFQPLNNSSAFPSNSCPVVRNLQSPGKNVYQPKFYGKMFSVEFLTRDKNDRSRDSWSSWNRNLRRVIKHSIRWHTLCKSKKIIQQEQSVPLSRIRLAHFEERVKPLLQKTMNIKTHPLTKNEDAHLSENIYTVNEVV